MGSIASHSYLSGPIDNAFGVPVEIGDYTSIAQGLEIFASDHPMKQVSTYPFRERHCLDYAPCIDRNKVVIGNDVWIGQSVAIRQGVTVGDGAVIAARAVVTKDVPPYAVIAGNPGKVIKYRFDKDTVEKLLKIEWWNWDFDKISASIGDFMDVKAFTEKRA